MKNRKSLMKWLKLAALCLPLIAAVSCAGEPDRVPLHIDAWEAATVPLGMVKPGPEPEDMRPLGGTRWLVTSINPKPAQPSKSMVFNFQSDGTLVETVVSQDGLEKSQKFPYHVVGSTLLINQSKGNINARFRIEGNLLMIDTGDTSMLLQRMK